MANYNDLITAIDSVIKTNNRREITGQLLQNVLNTMVGSLGENYQLAGFATPTTNPHQPDQNVFYVASQAGVYTQFDNIVLGDGISFLMWKNGAWTSQTISMVTQSWVQQNYVSKEWFRKVFRVYDEDGLEIVPNDMDSVVDNIKAMVGLWTNEYLSALGMGRDGGGSTQTLAQLNDVQLGTLANGDALVYNTAIHKWENKQIQTGVDMSVVWAALAANTNDQINASHLATALSGYVTSANLSTMLNDYATKAWAGQNFITVEWFDKLFQLYNGTEAEANKIAPNGALPVDKTQLNIEAMFGFWTKKYISALGQGDDGSAGSGDVTWELLASQATNGRFIHPSYLTQALAGYATQSWVTSNFATITQVNALEFLNQVTGGNGVLKLITNKSTEYDVDLSHEHSFLELLDRPDTIAGYGVTLTADDIPMLTKSKISDFPTTWAWSAITGKPNSIAGYGILDAKIENGVITLGGNSITPLISETYRGTVVSVGLSVPAGFSVSGTPITDSGTLAIAFASGYEGFTTDLKNKINALFSWFEVDANGNIKTKDYTENNETKHRGFYSPSFISALGMGDDGQAGQGDVTWALLASPATDGRTIHSSYIAAALAGYATQNWVQQQGYITSAQLSALEYLQTITGGDEVATFTTNKGTETILDFSHEHSWFELLDKPDTIAGLGVALSASDIPNLDWSKITTGKPSTLAGYGITDAVAFVAINGVNYSPVSGVVTLPVYTSTQVDALARLKTLALSDDGVLSFTHQDDSTTLVDFTHEHSFLELLDRPDTIKGYGITIEASDIPNLDWSKITTGKPTTLAGYGITDAKIVDGVITLGASSITPVTSVAMTVPTGFSVAGSPISKTGTLAVSYASGYEGFTTELKNKINTLFSWFEVDNDGNIKTKDYTDGGTTKHRGFYSPSFISALGQGDDGTAGTGDVTWALLATQATDGRTIHLSYISAALASYLTTNGYLQTSAIADMATQTWVGQQGFLTSSSLSNYYTKTEVDALPRIKAITLGSDGCLSFTWQDNTSTIADYSHEHSWFELLDRPDTLAGYGITLTADDIPNLPWSKITSGKPTTLAGYGITDAYISSGTITLGGNSITPLTSHQSMSDLMGSSSKGGSTTPLYWTGSAWATCTAYASASVNYATSAGYASSADNADTVDGYHASSFASSGHNHDGRYLYWAGSAADATAMGWGTLTAANGYTILSHFASSDGGDGGFVNNSGQIFMQIDGYFYQNEGAYRVYDVSGGDMNSGARISFSGGNGYLGNSNNAGWLMVQDMCSQNSAGDGVWSIRTNGNAIFQNVTSYGAVSALSDIRHKEIVRNTNLQVEQIAAMRSVIYRKKDSNDNTLYAGSIAQDWQSILPQVVSVADNDEHTQSLQYGVAALIAVITTARKVSEHERRIADLERENERLKEIINNLNVA